MTTRRTLLLSVYIPSALLAFSEGLLLPTLPLFALQFDVSFSVAALVIAASGIGTMFADVPAGMVLGRFGLKRTMIFGTALVAAALFALGFAQFLPLLILYRLADGVGRSMWAISRVSYIAEAIEPAERGRAISIFGGLNRIGMFAGPVSGGLAADAFGLRFAFILAGLLAVAALVVSLIWIDTTEVEVESSHRARWTLIRDLLRANWRDLSAASVAQMAGQMIRAGRQAIIPFYAEAVLGLSATQIGTIQSASSMIDMSLFFPAGYIMDRFGRKFTSVPSFAVMSIGLVLIPFTGGYFSLLLVSLVIGLGNGLGSGAMMTLGTDLAPRGAVGEFMGLWRFVGDSGRAGGPLVVGSLADSTGFTATAYILGGIGLASSATLLFLVRETRTSAIVSSSGPDPGG
ncbi:MAG: MFS transporter [Thermomicrobiales bacterium]